MKRPSYREQSTGSLLSSQIKIPIPLFTHRNNPKFYIEAQKTWDSQSNPEQQQQNPSVEGLTIPDFILFYRAMVMKTCY